ncbi:MAG: MFS transporter [Acidimicrobiia bacterium]|nr:MFS transporter [Acidimicrobiia bacterium]
MGRLRKWGRLAVVDITPLRRVSGYRWLFGGMFVMQVGRQLTVVAVPIQVYEITGSTLAVGLLGLVQLIPLLLVSLVGGALADAIDRKRLLWLSQVVMALTGAGLLSNSLADSPALWPLFVLSAANAGISAIDSPARTALLPGLVGRALLPSALALNQTQTNIAKAAIPAIGGLLIAVSGYPVTYGLQMMAFAVSAVLIMRIPNVKTEGGGRPFSMSSILEGFRFLKPRRVIQAAFLIDLSAMVFGMPTALFPAFGQEVLGGDAFTVGLLYTAPGIGALVGALTSGWVAHVRRQGTAVVLAVIGWGVSIAVFGLTSSQALALVMLALAGAADVVSAIFRGSIVQLSVPDSLRGRLSSMHMAVVAGGPRLGDLEAGVVAALTSVRFSIVSGGLACVLASLGIARWAPGFLSYEYDPDEPEMAASANQ